MNEDPWLIVGDFNALAGVMRREEGQIAEQVYPMILLSGFFMLTCVI